MLNSNAVYCDIIFTNRTQIATFLKKLLKIKLNLKRLRLKPGLIYISWCQSRHRQNWILIVSTSNEWHTVRRENLKSDNLHPEYHVSLWREARDIPTSNTLNFYVSHSLSVRQNTKLKRLFVSFSGVKILLWISLYHIHVTILHCTEN